MNQMMLATQPPSRGARAVSPHPLFAPGMFASELVVWEFGDRDEIIAVVVGGMAWTFDEFVGELVGSGAGDAPLSLWRVLPERVSNERPSKCPPKLQHCHDRLTRPQEVTYAKYKFTSDTANTN
jgi:hypothetical protein